MTEQKQTVNSKQKRWLTGGIILLPTFILLGILGQLFPYTGLAAIVIYPFIVILNFLLILITVIVTRQLKRPLYVIAWTFTLILTLHFVFTCFPQESRPSVYNQIKYSNSAINHFNEITIKDLDLPKTVIYFSRYDSESKNALEKYIVALYKFRKNIPLDGSFKIRQEVMSYGTENSIKSIDEIPNKLEGHYKLIWLILKRKGK